MKKSLLLASHLLALAAGWLAFQAADKSAAAPATGEPDRERRDERQRAEMVEGRRLLVEMQRGWGIDKHFEKQAVSVSRGPSIEDIDKQMRDQRAAELEKVRKKSAELTLPADPAAELLKLVKGPNGSDSSALAIAWLRVDPAAALRTIEGIPQLKTSAAFTQALTLWVGELDPEELAGLMKEAPSFKEKIAAAAMKVATQSGFAELGGLFEVLEAEVSRDGLLRGAFAQIPAASRGEALAWINENLQGREAGNAIMYTAMEIADAKEARAFLKQAIEGLDPEVLKVLKDWGNFGDIMRRGIGPDSTFDERVEARLAGGMIGKTDEERLANARSSIVAEDLGRWFREGHWGEALRFESATVPEIWSSAEANFPAFMQADRDGMLRTVFSKTALEAPEAALALLKAEGKEGRAAKYVLQVAESAMHSDYEAGFRLVAMLPEEALQAELAAYDRQYSYRIGPLAEQGGQFWSEWVRKQKPGLSRDLLLHYTAVQFLKQGREAESAELKALVRDSAIKERPLR